VDVSPTDRQKGALPPLPGDPRSRPILVTIDLPGSTEISVGYQYQKKDESDTGLHVWFGEPDRMGVAQGVNKATPAATTTTPTGRKPMSAETRKKLRFGNQG
jgi:hypothetical protein